MSLDIFECIKRRRSVRRYSYTDVTDETVLQIIDAARWAPFGGPLTVSCQLWEFIVVRSEATKGDLAHGDSERAFIETAPVVIACCADTRKDPEYRDYDITVALAVENMMLAATALGLGSCYVTSYGNHIAHGEERAILRRALNLPEHVRLVCLVAVGYPSEDPPAKPLREISEMVHVEGW